MNFKDIEYLRWMLENDGLQCILDNLAILLEEDLGNHGDTEAMEILQQCDCLREFTKVCK